MHCRTFSVILIILLLYVFYVLTECNCKSSMIGYREIRDDPNHTRYYYHTFHDVSPTLVYGDLQY